MNAFEVTAGEMLRVLQSAATAIPTNPVLPIIANVRIAYDGARITATGTDLEITVTDSTSAAGGAEPFAVCVKHKTLVDTLKTIPSNELVTFEYNPDNITLTLKTNAGKYVTSGMDADDFPQQDTKTGEAQTVRMFAETLGAVLQKVEWAASKDELKQAMAGVYLKSEGDVVHIVATDAHKLVEVVTTGEGPAETVDCIMPTKASKAIRAACKAGGDAIIQITSRHISVTIGDVTIACRTVDAAYPNYKAVIPATSSIQARIPRQPLVSSLKRVSSYANERTNMAAFHFSGSPVMRIVSSDADNTKQAEETLNMAGYDGGEISIGFNVAFAQECVNAIDGDQVYFDLDTPGRAALITSGQDDGVTILLMPLMINVSAY